MSKVGKIVYNIEKICPVYEQIPPPDTELGPFKIVLDPERSTSEVETCFKKGVPVEVDILGDRYTQTKGDVEVSCNGCDSLPGGFKRIFKERIS